MKTFDFITDIDNIKNRNVSLFDCIEMPKTAYKNWNKTDIKTTATSLAAAHLMRKGYDIVEVNTRPKTPIVLAYEPEDTKHKTLVRIEVRGSKPDDIYPIPPINCTNDDIEKAKAAAKKLLKENDVDTVQGDIISIYLTGARNAKLRHLISSFDTNDNIM